ncbi:hypothetical protein [Brachybacterium sp. Marseille-Q7125]|uniref:hypothetical protein n=1 Tax=Brachybacterium sp. Marseille-Q7125 TaxID=2932815 RepID=UPI001FF615BE|nr:hypothetical protein [Brachybacterium sp. Marseille-Q7125]
MTASASVGMSFTAECSIETSRPAARSLARILEVPMTLEPMPASHAKIIARISGMLPRDTEVSSPCEPGSGSEPCAASSSAASLRRSVRIMSPVTATVTTNATA